MERLIRELEEILGSENVLTEAWELTPYTRDYNVLKLHRELEEPSIPNVIAVQPGDSEEVLQVIRAAEKHGIKTVVYGGASSVVDVYHGEGLIIDLARLSDIKWYDKISGVVEVGSGAILREVEEWLNREGYTLGHYPQSIDVASIGGLIAMGSIGMYSAGYGGIEDILVGVEAVIPSIGVVNLPPTPRRNTPIPLDKLVVSSEACGAIVTKAYLRVYPKPDQIIRKAYLVETFEEGVERLHRLARYRIKPDMIRLLDETEAEALAGVDKALILVEIHGYEGYEDISLKKLDMVEKLIEPAEEASEEAFNRWLDSRRNYLAKIYRLYRAGIAVETIELSPLWSGVSKLYREVRERLFTIDSVLGVTAHIGHIHSIGVGLYLTILIDREMLSQTYNQIWETVMDTAYKYGGISHHHGIGAIRREALKRHYGRWMMGVARICRALDPEDILHKPWLDK